MKFTFFLFSPFVGFMRFSNAQETMQAEEEQSTAGNLRATVTLEDRNLRDIPKIWKCPPDVEYVTPWYCPWCNPTKDTTKLDIYNEIMCMYDDYGTRDAPAKAITTWLGKSSGKVGSFSDDQLQRVFLSAVNGNSCVRETFEDTVCSTLHFSDFFQASTLTTLQKLKALNTFRKFVFGISTGNAWAVATNTRKLMKDVVIPTMNRLIGGISFLTRTDPGNKFERDLVLQCSIH